MNKNKEIKKLEEFAKRAVKYYKDIQGNEESINNLVWILSDKIIDAIIEESPVDPSEEVKRNIIRQAREILQNSGFDNAFESLIIISTNNSFAEEQITTSRYLDSAKRRTMHDIEKRINRDYSGFFCF